MTPPRALLPILLGLAACGGGGGPSDDPGGGGVVVALQKPIGSGDGQAGVVGDTLAAPIIVLVTEDGTPSAGRVVTFTPAAGSGAVVPAMDTTDVNGLAQASWILGTGAGARSLDASTPGASGAPVTFHATALPAAPDSIVVVAGEGQAQEVGQPFGAPLVARTTDRFGNPVTGPVLSWSVAGGSGATAGATSAVAPDGLASMTVIAGDTPGPLVVRATAEDLPADTARFALVVTPVATVIGVASNFFSPAADTIAAGGAVRWVWLSGQHNVSLISGPTAFPGSPDLTAPETFGPVLFTAPGTYVYECSLHSRMIGTITVR